MTAQSRRDILKSTLTLAGLGLVGFPDWVLPALAQGETVVPFLDYPEQVITNPAPDRRIIDIRQINGAMTPKDQFFTTQHYGHPNVDLATFKLKLSGLVDRPLAPFTRTTSARWGARISSPVSSARATAGPLPGSVRATDAGRASRCARCSTRRA
jgi:hypothetical protein